MNKDYQIERGLTRIAVPHGAGTLAVAHPFYGPTIAKDLRTKIRANTIAQLREPTLAEVVSFANVAYKKDTEPEFRDATGIMKQRYFRGFTATHVADDKRLDSGLVYIVDFPEFADNGRVYVNNDTLVRMLKEKSSSARTIAKADMPQTGERTPKQLAKDKYVIALVGEEGAEKSAKLAERHPRKEGYVWVPQSSQPATTIAALGSYWVGRLYVSGYGELGDGGSAFGVLASAEGTSTREK